MDDSLRRIGLNKGLKLDLRRGGSMQQIGLVPPWFRGRRKGSSITINREPIPLFSKSKSQVPILEKTSFSILEFFILSWTLAEFG